MDAKEQVIDWLRDAYAMERGLDVTLQKLSQSENFPPEIQYAATQHLEDTRNHAQTVQLLLESLGAETSTIKTGLGMMTEALKAVSNIVAHDEVIKDLLGCYAMEHFEIACYRALLTAAEEAGLPEIAEACELIIFDEEQMVDILSDSLPRIVQSYMASEKISKAA